MKPTRSNHHGAALAFVPLVFQLMAAAAGTSGNLDGVNAKIGQLSKRGTTLDDVIALLGEPQTYLWEGEAFKKNNLPERFIARYPLCLDVLITSGTVRELRAEGAGPGFTWQGKLRLGSSLDEMLQALGHPSKTMSGRPVAFAPNVLYKDIEDRPGSAYYARPGQHVRCVLSKNHVTALYVTVEEPEGGGKEWKSLPTNDPDEPSEVDLRKADLSKLDLRASPKGLIYADFDDRAVWPPPEQMPVGFDWQKTMELGKNPGLGVRRLHEKGITGRGVKVAIIDQPLLVHHQEYAGRVRLYEEMDLQAGTEPEMHGAAVASIALGKTVGVAPEAELYYIAMQFTDENTLQRLARCVHRIIELNAQLPKDNKIRVISISKGWVRSDKGYDDIKEAVERAQDAGMLVLYMCSDKRFYFGGLGRSPLADPDVFGSYEPPVFLAKRLWDQSSSPSDNTFSVPIDSRTTASHEGIDQYAFYRIGGMSWACPYIAGVYALAVQADPGITPKRFWTLAAQTGRIIELKRQGTTRFLGPIVDPAKLIQAIQSGDAAALTPEKQDDPNAHAPLQTNSAALTIVLGVGVGDCTLGMSKDEVLKRRGEPEAVELADNQIVRRGEEKYNLKELPGKCILCFGDVSFSIRDKCAGSSLQTRVWIGRGGLGEEDPRCLSYGQTKRGEGATLPL